MTSRILLFSLVAFVADLHAAPRSWKSDDGQRSIQGEFVKRDATSVTIRRSDRKEVILQLDKLHPDDRTWVNANHPLPKAKAPGKPQNDVPDLAAVFDQLCFGDTRDQVLAKLKASKFVEMTTDETFIGRSGLNGVFRTRSKIGSQFAMLYFDWTADNKLKELTLQTDPLPPSDLEAKLTPCWKGFIGLLTTLHGKPLAEDSQLRLSSIKDGSLASTHLWKLEKTGSALLGAARDGEKYQIVVRFTTEEVKPVEVP